MDGKKLRSGYTTGTCASAAAKAAAFFALTGRVLETVSIRLPMGKLVALRPCLYTEGMPPGSSGAVFGVLKDAGDDPDVTDKSWICATVRRLDAAELENFRRDGSGYWLARYPNLYLNGGQGVGVATKPGLTCPVGHAAINPVPRQMILSAVAEVCQELHWQDGLLVSVLVPGGELLAEKTFNPRLGIAGGISILGTTGEVKPMSEEALKETIRLEIHMRAVRGQKILLLTPGNYGETFLQKQLQIPAGEAVLCSNFVADSVRSAAEEGVGQVLFAGHIGKLVKVSAGIPNTHSRYGDGRMEEMAELTRQVLRGKTSGETGLWRAGAGEPGGSPAETEAGEPDPAAQILRCSTTEEAMELLKEAGLAEPVLNLAAERAKGWLETWSEGRISAEVVTFSGVPSGAPGIAGSTKMAGLWVQRLNGCIRNGEPPQ